MLDRLRRKSRVPRERNAKRTGFIGTALLIAALLAALNYQSLPFIGGGTSYSAQFSELGGLQADDPVEVGGIVVGSVDSVQLVLKPQAQYVKVSFTVTDDSVRLGARTTASIGTTTVLGRKALMVTPQGDGSLRDSTILLASTRSPFDITDDLQGLGSKIQQIDTGELTKALDTVSQTFGNTSVPLQSALDGLSRVSQTVSSRDQLLQTLLQHASSITGVLASRNQQIDVLLSDGAQLFQQLVARKQVIDQLFVNVSAVTSQLAGLATDQQTTLKPALSQLNKVLGQLNASRSQLAKIINGLAQYAATLGDAVGSGPFFDAYIANLSAPGTLPIDPNGIVACLLHQLNPLGPGGSATCPSTGGTK